MTRIPFDQLSKQFLQEFLAPLGAVERSLEIPGEPKFVDIWFQPSSQSASSAVDLGLLSRMATTACSFEPFRNSPSRSEVRTCILKLFWMHEELQRQSEREKRNLAEAELPILWILTSSASQALLSDFGAVAKEDWLPGVYFLATSLKTAIISISQFPQIEETLWLRILGKGETQQQAITEIIALPPDDPRRSRTLHNVDQLESYYGIERDPECGRSGVVYGTVSSLSRVGASNQTARTTRGATSRH